MRRAIPILLATVFGVTLLANFRTSPGPTALTTPGGAKATSPVTNPTPSTGAPPLGGNRSASAPSTGPSPTTTRPSASTRTRVVDGAAEVNRFGTVQVRVTLAGDRLVEVEALQVPDEHPRSVQITELAVPKLRQEALDTQTAQIHTVSGATYTSNGYRQSLQAALDQAGRS